MVLGYGNVITSIVFDGDLITHPCHNVIKLPLKLWHGWVITSHSLCGWNYISNRVTTGQVPSLWTYHNHCCGLQKSCLRLSPRYGRIKLNFCINFLSRSRADNDVLFSERLLNHDMKNKPTALSEDLITLILRAFLNLHQILVWDGNLVSVMPVIKWEYS